MAVLNNPALRPLHRLVGRLSYLVGLAAAVAVVYLAASGPIWPGAVVVVLGELMQIWAAGALRKNQAIAVAGPYAWVRNPMYLGRLVVGVGFALLAWRWWLVAACLLVFPLYAQARVLREEARLRGIFGAEYEVYCARVPRWLPRRPARGELGLGWSFANAWRNHEVHFAAFMLLVIVAVVVRRQLL